jgi:hypothetical protein
MLQPPHRFVCYMSSMPPRSYRPRRRRRSPLDGFAAYFENFRRLRRKRDRDTDDGGVPVEPNKPSTLTGGAAAELEFDD